MSLKIIALGLLLLFILLLLIANAESQSTFSGWGGSCTGTQTTCQVTVNNTTTKNVTATFTAAVCGSGLNCYYVTPTGSGTACSQAQPCGTLQQANSTVVAGAAGAIVYVAGGTYNSGQIVTSKSGTSSGRIVFQCNAQWSCNIRLTSGAPANIWGVNGSWVDVTGFDISETVGLTTTYGLVAQGSHVRFIGNRIHDLPGSAATGTCGSNGGAGISLPNNVAGTTDNQALANWVHDIGSPGQCNKIHGIYAQVANSVVENNIVYRVAAWGLNCSHACTGTVTNNTAFSNGGFGTSDNGTFAMGGCVLLGSDSTASGITVDNNICKDNGASGSGAAIFNITGTINNLLIANNLIQNSSSGNGAGSAQGCTTQATCISTGSGTGQIVTANLFNVSPGFVNYQANGSGDYSLTLGSAAVNAGTTACASGTSNCVPLTDFNGVSRPQGTAYDIGAYESH